ncbi:MAG TPA: aminoglycoside phosphotransferase family protein [Candidatus Dormibacteraeota bacterium]
MLTVSDPVRNKALALGASAWLEELPGLVGELERDWSLTLGRPCAGATEAFVAEATCADGSPAVLKVALPGRGEAHRHEVTALRLDGGLGCAQLLQEDPGRRALLLERLGRSLYEIGPPLERRLEVLCAAAARVWRPAAGCGLPTGAAKGRWLQNYIATAWEELRRPCSEAAMELALVCAGRRVQAHDDERAVLVHGDVHQWNALESPAGFKLVDPDGLLAEAEYDLGILMREDPENLLAGDSKTLTEQRAAWLARRTGLDAAAIWEWGAAERVATGLLCTRIELQPAGRDMLRVADRIAE